MDRLVYTALTGMQRAQESQGITAHNLANAATPGFRREMAANSAAWLTSEGSAVAGRVQSGGEAPHDLHRAGSIDVTGRPLDIAMNGNAWLAVTNAQGAEGLTRRGDLRFTPDGTLTTGDGHSVMGEGGPIRLTAAFGEARITSEGSIEARATAEAPFAKVGQLKLVSPDIATLSRGADGLFRATTMEADETATITTGAIERSNVESASELVELVQQSRSFEMQTKLLAAAREMDEGSAALMRVD